MYERLPPRTVIQRSPVFRCGPARCCPSGNCSPMASFLHSIRWGAKMGTFGSCDLVPGSVTKFLV